MSDTAPAGSQTLNALQIADRKFVLALSAVLLAKIPTETNVFIFPLGTENANKTLASMLHSLLGSYAAPIESAVICAPGDDSSAWLACAARQSGAKILIMADKLEPGAVLNMTLLRSLADSGYRIVLFPGTQPYAVHEACKFAKMALLFGSPSVQNGNQSQQDIAWLAAYLLLHIVPECEARKLATGDPLPHTPLPQPLYNELAAVEHEVFNKKK